MTIESLDALTSNTLRVIFNAKNAMEAYEFFAMCNFSSTIPRHLENMFRACVYKMTYNAQSRFVVFITWNEYFGGKVVNIEFHDMTNDSLISSSTCFEKLYLPLYKDMDTMYRKIC